MGARASKKSAAVQPPAYDYDSTELAEHSNGSSVFDAVLEKYVRCATYNTTNGYLNENFKAELLFLIECKTGRCAKTKSVLLLCNLYAEQLKKYKKITDFYEHNAFFFNLDVDNVASTLTTSCLE